MGGKEHGDLVLCIQLPNEFTNGLLPQHIHSNGGFIKKDDLGRMQQSCHNIGTHSLPQGELTDRLIDEAAHIQHFHKSVQILAILLLRNPIDRL